MTFDKESLFLPSLISPAIQEALPQGYTIRPLQQQDYDKGFIHVLSQLSTTGEISREAFQEQFNRMQMNQCYFVVCVETENTIVACATLFVEHKFLHKCGRVGHIEDVVVLESQRGKRLGFRLIEQLTCIARTLGCYKMILNCASHNVPFYEKCKLEQTAVQMAYYFK